MEEIGRSTLVGKNCKLIGFGFMPHPIRKGYFLNVVFYEIGPEEFVICTGEGKGKGRPQDMRPNLGTFVPGDIIAPYAQRHLKGMPYADFKQAMNEGFSGLEWWK